MKPINSVAKLWLNNTSCSDCGLHKICISRGLSSSELKHLDEIVSSNLIFQAETSLYRQGDPFYGFYAIKSGSTKSCVLSEHGNAQIVGFQFAGDILGLDAFEHLIHTTSIIFLENAIVCHIPLDRFDHLCNKISRLHHELRQKASHEITHDHEVLMTINQKSAEQRIAFFLMEITNGLHLAERNPEAGFHLPMQRKDIANYLGLSQETVSRIFTRFEREGMISVSGKQVGILDRNRLRLLANICSCN